MRLVLRLLQRLAAPRADAIVIVLATLLLLPSLTTGYAVDDHLHRIVMRDETLIAGFAPSKLDLFEFASGDPADMQQLMDRGIFPWTTEPTLRLRFMRPLSALTHVVDDALWPEAPALAHLQNLAWFALLLVVVARLYRRIHVASTQRWVAGLALLLYALDDAHAPTVGWIANRQAIIAAVFGFAALLAHHARAASEWRSQTSRATSIAARLAAPLLLALSLLAGESGIASVGYLFAYTVTIDRRPDRWRALIPHAVVVLAWGVTYVALHYGAKGSGLYVEPLADPLGFAQAAVSHLPVLVTGQFAGIWSELYAALTGTAATLFVVGCSVYVLLLLDVLKVTLKVSPEARFWALGMFLSVVPICSTIPADRLLIFVGVGAMGLVACFISAPEGIPGVTSASRVRRVSVNLWLYGLVLTHLVIAPLVLPIRSLTMKTVGDSMRRADDSVPSDASIADKTVIAINPPADTYLAFVPIMRASMASSGRPAPRHVRWLAVGQTDIEVTREAPNTLRVSPAGGYLAMASEQLVRDPDNRFDLGQRVMLTGVTVEVVALTDDGRPASTRWTFDRPLEDPSLLWLQWSDHPIGFAPYTPPPVGTTSTLAAIDALRAFMGD